MSISAPGVSVVAERSRVLDLLELAKPRISVLAAVTATCGCYLAQIRPDARLLSSVFVATMFVAGGSCALNQYIERAADGLMRRTCNRPIPAGRFAPGAGLVYGAMLILTGLIVFAMLTTSLATCLAAFTALLYLALYTPLKMRTPLCTIVGAVPGAMPPVLGWAAATGHLSTCALVLFVMMFLWQLPHFLAISWIYREDYARARMRILAVVDRSGQQVRLQMVLFAGAMLAATLGPAICGIAGQIYLAGALILGAGYLALVVRWSVRNTVARARHVFFASLIHIALLFSLMIANAA